MTLDGWETGGRGETSVTELESESSEELGEKTGSKPALESCWCDASAPLFAHRDKDLSPPLVITASSFHGIDGCSRALHAWHCSRAW